MTTTHPTGPAPRRWAVPALAAAMTAGFALLAFRLSFASLTALAAEHGVEADVVWMFAVLVDGGAVVGTVGVIMAKRAHRSQWPYWLTVAAFASTSLGFNIGHSDGTGAGVAIAVTPPLAQLVATELLVRMLPDADTDAVTVDDVAPTVARADAAARRATDAVTVARAAADAAQTAADAAATAVTDAARAARTDTRDTVANAVDRILDTAATVAATVADAQEAAAAATAAAARAEQAAATVTDTVAPPLALVDLAAAVAAVDVEEQPLDTAATVADAVAPMPFAATFTAPPLPTPDVDTTDADTATAPHPYAAAGDPTTRRATTTDAPPPSHAVTAYRHLIRKTGTRPTAEQLGAALGVKRTRGSELRRMVEAHLATA